MIDFLVKLMDGIVFIIVFFIILPYALCWMDRLRGSHWSCNLFGWHDGKLLPNDGKTFDGCNFIAKCSKCGKEVMMDSQGNWFLKGNYCD